MASADALVPGPATPHFRAVKTSFEAELILRMLDENRGNVSRTAQVMGLSRRTLHLKIQKLGIPLELVHRSRRRLSHSRSERNSFS